MNKRCKFKLSDAVSLIHTFDMNEESKEITEFQDIEISDGQHVITTISCVTCEITSEKLHVVADEIALARMECKKMFDN